MDFILLIAIAYLGWSVGEKLTHLMKRIQKLERLESGGSEMLHVLKGLEGKQCKFQFDNFINYDHLCFVLEVDDEWVKLKCTDKKGGTTVKAVRIDNIKEIEIVET